MMGPMAHLNSAAGERRSTPPQARQTLHDALQRVEEHTGLTNEAEALTALQTVTEALVQRLTVGEATDLISELPSALHAALLEAPAGPNRQLTADSIRHALAQRLSLEPDQAAAMLPAVAGALRELVSPGEMQDMLAQLPRELREILTAPEVKVGEPAEEQLRSS